jgi:hypothetical protein
VCADRLDNALAELSTDAPLCVGFAGNDSPSFVFPTAIAIKGSTGGGGGSGSGRPAVAQKPSYLTGGAGPSGHLSGKRGTEDLDYFIGDEALAQSSGLGTLLFWIACEGGRGIEMGGQLRGVENCNANKMNG